MSTPRWVCLDVGEVLIDETRVWSAWAAHLGTTPLTFGAVLGAEIAAGRGHREALARFGVADNDIPRVEARIGPLRADDLYPDALAGLDALAASGLRVAVAGNQPARRTAELRTAGVDAAVLVTSEELGVEKPAPGFFAAVLDLLGAAPGDVCYVGDRADNDIAPARAAGLRTAWLRRGPWAALTDPATVAADWHVDGLTQLVAALDGPWPGDAPD